MGKLTGQELTGTLSLLDGTTTVYHDVANYDYGGGSITGTLKITLPVSWTNTMLSIEIDGYDYSGKGSWKLTLGGYNYTTTPSWVNTKAQLNGIAPFTSVRFAHDGTKCCILLGVTSTVWSYPKIVISKVIAGHSNIKGYDKGWSTSCIATETGITSVVLISPLTNFDSIITTNNGNGTNIRIGDDVWLGDINLSNGMRITGVDDSSKVHIQLGTSANSKIGTDTVGSVYLVGETHMWNPYVDAGYVDPWSGTPCALKVTGNIASTNYIKGKYGQFAGMSVGSGDVTSNGSPGWEMQSTDGGTPFIDWKKYTDVDYEVRLINSNYSYMDVNFRSPGTFRINGTMSASTKSAIAQTPTYGEVYLYCDESPNHVFCDRGRGATDINGECYVMLDPCFIETVNTKSGDYWVQLTGFEGANVELSRLEQSYFVVKGQPNKEFCWEVNAERKGYERLRWNNAQI